METLTEKVMKTYFQWKTAQQQQTSGYDYEKSFVEMWQTLGKEVFQESIGEIPKDKNKKNFTAV